MLDYSTLNILITDTSGWIVQVLTHSKNHLGIYGSLVAVSNLFGFMNKILRVNLSNGKITEEPLSEDVARKYL